VDRYQATTAYNKLTMNDMEKKSLEKGIQ
jgi:hypothetical protein